MRSRACVGAVLSLLALPGCLGAAQAQRAARAEATLAAVQRLDAALRACARETGSMPDGTTIERVRELSSRSAPDGEPYLAIIPSVHLRGGDCDAWDRILVVRVPGTGRPADVYSLGEDGRDESGGGDDVSAWAGFDRARYGPRINRVEPALAGGWGGALLATFAAGLAVRRRRRAGGGVRNPG